MPAGYVNQLTNVNQPIPTVTRADVERIVRRDFADREVDRALRILDECGKETSRQNATRVRLAALKLAAGDLEGLQRTVKEAAHDWRDVIASAEYPAYMKFRSTTASPPEEKRAAIDADWAQYQDWLRR